jgi:hypothetical protein
MEMQNKNEKFRSKGISDELNGELTHSMKNPMNNMENGQIGIDISIISMQQNANTNANANTDANDEKRYYFIKPCHFILFGNGQNKYLMLPISYIIFVLIVEIIEVNNAIASTASTASHAEAFGLSIVISIAFITMLILMLYFGMCMCAQRYPELSL